MVAQSSNNVHGHRYSVASPARKTQLQVTGMDRRLRHRPICLRQDLLFKLYQGTKSMSMKGRRDPLTNLPPVTPLGYNLLRRRLEIKEEMWPLVICLFW